MAIAVAFGASLAAGCSDSTCRVALEGESCQSTSDCTEAGFIQLACVDGRCRATCLDDFDCREVADRQCEVDPEVSSAICEQRLCRAGCPVAPCATDETCFDGRCALYREGFEGRGNERPSLAGLGWGGQGELRNPNLALGFDCDNDCGGEDSAGPAAEGRRFAIIGSEPAPEKGTARTAPTCRACACCLDCILNRPLLAPSILDCPVNAIPPRLRCGPARTSCDEAPPPEGVPDVCNEVCVQCDQCAERSAPPNGRGLTACEAQAAGKVCRPCQRCDDEACRECRAVACEQACEDVGSAECETCETSNGCGSCADCRDCTACEDAESAGPRQAELRARCDGLGADGCFSTPVEYPRAELTDGEQALTSPPIDLSGGVEDLEIQFRYVPFNIGSVYTVTEQGVSSCDWQEAPQEVRVQACGGGCEAPEAWVDLLLSDGEMALPPEPQRGNGLRLAGQSGIDWSIGRARAVLPGGLRSTETRIRFLPRLSEFARLGVDEILIRRRGP